MKKLGNYFSILAILVISFILYLFFGYIKDLFLNMPYTYRWLAFFMVSFIGATSVIFPIPYTVIIFLLASRIPNINPLEIAVFSGLGSALGEVVGWVLGRLVTGAVSTSTRRRADALLRIIRMKGEWFVPIVVFLFAFTPLPDDILFIGLGLVNYPLLKALIPCVAGKITMLYVISFFGVQLGSASEGLDDLTISLITLAVLIAIILIVFKVDWESILEKNASKNRP
ncbi:MAG: hypothetical protein DRJ32_07075 [Thermoprotei archaeon]|nr:MAG: hypothetical protein DRJ32_07075 [Thermoprotei archaeon]